MERVADMLERQLASGRLQLTVTTEEGPVERLLTSPSADSMAGLRSPGTATPDPAEAWQPPALVLPDESAAAAHEPHPADESAAVATSPFSAAAQQPLPEGSQASCSGAAGPSGRPRGRQADASPEARAAEQWRGSAGVSALWLAAAVVTLVADWGWFPLGLFAGVLGTLGAGAAVYGQQLRLRLRLNLLVTRLLAAAAGALAAAAAAAAAFLLAALPCPGSLRLAGRCLSFRLGLAVAAAWHALLAALAALVAYSASRALALLPPLEKPLAVRVIVARPPAAAAAAAARQASGSRSRSLQPRGSVSSAGR